MNKKPYLQCTGEDWQKQRMRALVRDEFTCQFHKLGLTDIDGGCCQQRPETKLRNLHVHHIQERQHGGNHDLDNLITICRAHHIEMHPHMKFEYAAKDKVLGGWVDKEL